MTADWSIVPLGTLLTDVQPGFASGRYNSDGLGIPHFRPMNVSSDGRIERSAVKYIEASAWRDEVRLRRGDILFNNTNSPELVGKTALFTDDDAPAYSNHMTRLRLDETRLDAAYTAIRLHQAWRDGWFAAHANNHVSQASVSREVLKSFEIEVPPLAIQRAIAALSAAVDGERRSASNHLAAGRRMIERFRQTVLAAACMGRLTREWRLTHNDNGAQCSGFLESILRSRKHKVRKEPLAPFIDAGLPDLPKSWGWASADALTTLITKGTTPQASDMRQGGGEIPYIKVYNLSFDGVVDFRSNPTFIPRKVHDGLLKRSRVFPGDLLLNIVGPPLGKVGVVPSTHAEWNINQAIAVFRLVPGGNPDFMKLWLRSPQALSHFARRAKATAGQYNLTLEICRELPVPVPCPEEQQEIVRRATRLLTMIDAIGQKIEHAQTVVDRISQAVLAKAIQGELVG